ncbi:hypothetical protein GYMLUDRAFT_45948 [Collybiopsis luxurians FD-317 M1]|jgi:hypothetical protein|uniref:RlpA-like protein double-psi beta-barrel domain-containing protein n=1 Tax=Collybiopsis luxurians FD-317 M1 TaxID=944289 RepID=A0A0D0C5H3_9AGAR|nr:hypothetical protein GYMLUDRAFT_45948 [Collybiopsis luxurians FD-317 M1]
MHALSVATFVLFSAQAALGRVVPRKEAPSTYAEGYLEPYQQYHTRYLAIGCQFQHNNATFFNACCHPMLATETLETARPSYCIPSSAASSSAAAAQATSDNSTDDDDTDDCDDGDEDESSSTPAPTHSATSESHPESSSSSSPTSTHTHTQQPSTHTQQPSTPTQPPATHTQQPAPQTTSSSAHAAPSSDSSSGSSQVFTGGHATFFYQNGVAGACGQVHSDSDFIIALDQQRYGNSGDRSQYCGRTIAITANGKTVNGVVADDCPTCDNENSLDLSSGLFQQFYELSVGEFDMSWQFV